MLSYFFVVGLLALIDTIGAYFFISQRKHIAAWSFGMKATALITSILFVTTLVLIAVGIGGWRGVPIGILGTVLAIELAIGTTAHHIWAKGLWGRVRDRATSRFS